MRTYAYKVVVEPDEGGWHAYCPALRAHGAVTQGATEAEAYAAINEVVQMVIDELRAEGKPLRQVRMATLGTSQSVFSRFCSRRPRGASWGARC